MKIRLIAVCVGLLCFNRIQAQEMNAEQLYKKINPAIVSLYTFDAYGKPLSQGSGVVINQKGWVVTNYHVYGNASKIIIKHKSKEIKDYEILAADIKRDLLILKITDNSFPSIILANSDLLNVGQKIYTIGSPLGLENSISDGIISGIRTDDETLGHNHFVGTNVILG